MIDMDAIEHATLTVGCAFVCLMYPIAPRPPPQKKMRINAWPTDQPRLEELFWDTRGKIPSSMRSILANKTDSPMLRD